MRKDLRSAVAEPRGSSDNNRPQPFTSASHRRTAATPESGGNFAQASWRMAAAAIAVSFVMAMPATLWGQSKSDSRPFTASVLAGIARPSDQAFRELYGGIQYPVSIQTNCELSHNVLIFGEYGYVRHSGKTQTIDADFTPGDDVLRFRTHTANVGLLYAFPLRKVTLLAGGGAGFRLYRETWAAAGVTTTGMKAGLVLQGGAEYEMTRILALVGRVEYSRMEIKAASAMENDVGLGRLEASIGISFRLNRLLHK